MRPLTLLSIALALSVAAPAAQEAAGLAAPAAYPNPLGRGTLTIAYATEGRAEAPALEVLDLLGRRVSSEGVLPAGVYLLRLRWPDGRLSAAQPLTKLASGPLDVRLAPYEAGSTSGAAPAASTAEPPAEGGCTGPLVWEGLRHQPLGSAQLGVNPAGDLVLSDLGSSGNDGVRTCLGNASGAGAQFAGLALDQSGLSFVWDLDNDGIFTNQPVARATFKEAGGLVNAGVDLTGLGAMVVTIDVWEHAALVHTETISAGAVPFTLGGVGAGGVVLSRIIMANTEGDFAQVAGASGVAARSLTPVLISSIKLEHEGVVAVGLGSGVYVGDRIEVEAAVSSIAVVRESRMRFANTGPVALEDHQLAAMGHFHSAPDTLDTTTFLLNAGSPGGPLAAVCGQGGCSGLKGVEVRARPGSERLHADLQPVPIPRGGNGFFDVFFEWDAVSRQPGATPHLNLQSTAQGVILRMEKENCDEGAPPDECMVTFEYVRNGQVLTSRTVRAGTAIPVRRSITVRSAEVALDNTPGGTEKPITWEIRLGVSILGGSEVLRVSGNGNTPAALRGLSLHDNRTQPMVVTAVRSCPGDVGCPPEPDPLVRADGGEDVPFEVE
jgi:hypothetical protein